MATSDKTDATVDKTTAVDKSTDVTGTVGNTDVVNTDAVGATAPLNAPTAAPLSDAPVDNTDFTVVGVDVTKPPMLNPNTGLAETTLIKETPEEVAAVNAAAEAAKTETE